MKKLIVNITSWVGISGNAEHSYGKVREIETGDSIYEVAENFHRYKYDEYDLERELTDLKEVLYLKKKERNPTLRVGRKTYKFNTEKQIKETVMEMFPDDDIAFLDDNELVAKDSNVIKRTPTPRPPNTGQKIKIQNFQGFSSEFVNLTEGSVHEVIEVPEEFSHRKDIKGVWVWGITEPVRVLPEEYVKLN